MRQGIEAERVQFFKFQLLISCSRRIPAAAHKTAELQLFCSFFFLQTSQDGHGEVDPTVHNDSLMSDLYILCEWYF